MGQVLLYFLSVSRSVDAKPKLPFIKSSGFSGLFTPARLKMKSASLQYVSRSAGSVSISYSKISISASMPLDLSLPSLTFWSAAQRFLPTKPFAPVTRIFINYFSQAAISSLIYWSERSFSFTCSTLRSSVLLELNSLSFTRSVSPSLKYLS